MLFEIFYSGWLTLSLDFYFIYTIKKKNILFVSVTQSICSSVRLSSFWPHVKMSKQNTRHDKSDFLNFVLLLFSQKTLNLKCAEKFNLLTSSVNKISFISFIFLPLESISI